MMSPGAAAAIGAGLPPVAIFIAYLWCMWDEKRGKR
jgi:hypothetical protein